MKGNLLQKKQKNKKLLIVLAIFGAITIFNFGKPYINNFGISTFQPVLPSDIGQLQEKDINIDFQILKNLRNDESLSKFEMPIIEGGDFGRKNPYIPYYEIEEE